MSWFKSLFNKKKPNTVIIAGPKKGPSEETLQALYKAQERAAKQMLEQRKNEPLDLVVVDPNPSLLPELDYIGNGRYRFKSDNDIHNDKREIL